jgi:hypothetical protein
MFAKSAIKIEKSVGDKTQPCFDPNSWSNQSDSKSPNILESNTILGETQGAFRKDGRIEDQIFPLQGIASLYKSSKKNSLFGFFGYIKGL